MFPLKTQVVVYVCVQQWRGEIYPEINDNAVGNAKVINVVDKRAWLECHTNDTLPKTVPISFTTLPLIPPPDARSMPKRLCSGVFWSPGTWATAWDYSEWQEIYRWSTWRYYRQTRGPERPEERVWIGLEFLRCCTRTFPRCTATTTQPSPKVTISISREEQGGVHSQFRREGLCFLALEAYCGFYYHCWTNCENTCALTVATMTFCRHVKWWIVPSFAKTYFCA